MDATLVVETALVAGLALLCQASERRKFAAAMRLGVVVLTLALTANGLLALAGGLASTSTARALGLQTPEDHGRLLAEGALVTGAGVLALLLFATGTRGLPGLRRLRPGAPISWLALTLYLQALAGNLTPAHAEATVATTAGTQESARALIVNEIPFAVVAVAAVGPGVRRTWAAAAARLGLLPLRLEWLPLAVGLGALLVLVGSPLADALTHLAPPDCVAQQQQVARSLQGTTRTVPEQLGIAVAAAVGEESLFRGALQPRVGILLASVLWATFHLQYTCHGFPSAANLYILLLGLVFGAARSRGGLGAAIVAHATYDATILLDVPIGVVVVLIAVAALTAFLVDAASRRRIPSSV